MTFQDIRTETITANNLHFEVDICGEGEKLALFLHGFPESKYSWRLQMPVLAKLGYTAWAPDLRGYGHSSRPLGIESYKIDHLMDDVAGLIDAARERGITGPITLIMHDWGGIIGWSFALRKLRPLEKIIVLNIPHPTLFAKGVRKFAQFKRSWYTLFFQIPWLPEKLLGANHAEGIGRAFTNMAVDKSRFPESVIKVYRDNAAMPGALTAMINYYRAVFRFGAPPEWKEPPIIEAPTLMIWGTQDTALGKELTYGTDELVPNLTLRYLDGVSHWVQQEAPETVNAMIECWLTGQKVPEAGYQGRLIHDADMKLS